MFFKHKHRKKTTYHVDFIGKQEQTHSTLKWMKNKTGVTKNNEISPKRRKAVLLNAAIIR